MRILVDITFCAVKIRVRDISLSQIEPFDTRDTAVEFGTPEKFGTVGNPRPTNYFLQVTN